MKFVSVLHKYPYFYEHFSIKRIHSIRICETRAKLQQIEIYDDQN